MELSTRFDSAANLRIHHLSGRVVLEPLCKALADLYTGPEYCPDHNALWDVREAKLAHLSVADLWGIAKFVNGAWRLITGPPKIAVVVSGAFTYGVASQVQASLEGSSVLRVFRDVVEARTWLRSRV